MTDILDRDLKSMDVFLPFSDLLKLKGFSIARVIDITAGQVVGDSGSVARKCRGPQTHTTTESPPLVQPRESPPPGPSHAWQASASQAVSSACQTPHPACQPPPRDRHRDANRAIGLQGPESTAKSGALRGMSGALSAGRRGSLGCSGGCRPACSTAAGGV